MTKRPHQRQIEDHICDQGDDSNTDRGTGVFAREEARRQHLDQDIGRQTNRKSRQRPGGCHRIRGIEPAMLEQGRDNRQGNDNQCHRRRQGEQQRHLDGAVLVRHCLSLTARP